MKRVLIAVALVLLVCFNVNAFERISVHKNIAERSLLPSTESAQIFNDQTIATQSREASSSFFIGDLDYGDTTGRDQATIVLYMAYANVSKAADTAAITVCYEVSNDGTSWTQPATPNNISGLFGSDAAAGGTGVAGNINGTGIWVAPSVSGGAGPYAITNTFRGTFSVSPTSFIRFKAVNSEAAQDSVIDLVGFAK